MSESAGTSWYAEAPEVQRVPISNSAAIMDCVSNQRPVVITESSVIKPSLMWSPQYLNKFLSPEAQFTVFQSKTGSFRYWDESKNTGRYVFMPPTTSSRMSYQEFYALKKSLEAQGEGKGIEQKNNKEELMQRHEDWLDCVDEEIVAAGPPPVALASASDEGKKKKKKKKKNKTAPLPSYAVREEGIYTWLAPTGAVSRCYLQHKLTEAVGWQLTDDFLNFDWEQLLTFKPGNWGPLTTNMLLVSQAGNITPAHYDEQENFFGQAYGTKRVILFPPDDVWHLYPYPIGHSCDRQSMIDFDNIDLTRFPNFPKARPVQVVLQPGEVLYIPSYWWHHIISEVEAVSVNFWFQAAPVTGDTVVFPLQPHQLLSLTRNVEKLLGSAVGPENADEALGYISKLVQGNTASEDIPETYSSLFVQVSGLLKHVMKPEEIGPFMVRLHAGRYGVIPKK